jgi:pyruvate kinase
MRQPGRKSKIVCTIGPAVASYEGICELIRRGMDVARLNFSHGSHEDHRKSVEWIRRAARELNIEVGILGDLQGPKIRTGKLLDPKTLEPTRSVPIEAGQEFVFTGVDIGTVLPPALGTEKNPITISYARLGGDMRKGDLLLFDDGLQRMIVTQTDKERNLVWAEVQFGKALGENKGVNMPGARLSSSGITEKDWDDILFGIEVDVDFLALSFVRSSREVKSLKSYLDQKGVGIHVIAKIEKDEAVEAIDDILFYSDGIMVARGDLGVEIGNEKVPLVQKQLIRRARRAGKPVITATQMLMSMVDNPTPSRAEASDVANAVLDGSDALMLSNESATGKYPFESVTTMSNIIVGAETLGSSAALDTSTDARVLPLPEAIDIAAAGLADNLGAKGITCLTRSGLSARLLAKHRPRVPIFAFAEDTKVRAQLCLSWGVNVVPWKEMSARDHSLFDELIAELVRLNLLSTGDSVVMTAGIPTTLRAGSTNTVVVKSVSKRS